MTIEELNKLIQEELKAYLDEDQTDEAYMEDGDEDAPEADGDDDIEVTTDEPEEGGEDDALDTLRQIYNMLKPIVEPEEEEEPEMDMDDAGEEEEEEEVDEAVGYPNYKADQISKVTADATDINKGLNESVERFKKLANIKG